MSATSLLAAASGALLAAGLVQLGPDVAPSAAALRVRLVPALTGADRRPAARLVRPLAIALGVVVLLAGHPLVALVVGGGPVVARALATRAADRRRRAVSAGAPLVARAVADAVDAGHGARRALVEASRATGVTGPAADELRRTASRLHAGDPLPASLAAWRSRTDEPAHATLIAGLLLHGEAGGELADVLRDQAASLERARRATADADGATVQARAAARIVGGIPVLGLVGAAVFAPDALRAVVGSVVGAILVLLALVLQAIAIVAVRRLTAGLGR